MIEAGIGNFEASNLIYAVIAFALSTV